MYLASVRAAQRVLALLAAPSYLIVALRGRSKAVAASCCPRSPLSSTNHSQIRVLPVLGVVDNSLALNMRVEAIVGVHAGAAEVPRELHVAAVEDGALWGDLGGAVAVLSTACAVDDARVLLVDFCNG